MCEETFVGGSVLSREDTRNVFSWALSVVRKEP